MCPTGLRPRFSSWSNIDEVASEHDDVSTAPRMQLHCRRRAARAARPALQRSWFASTGGMLGKTACTKSGVADLATVAALLLPQKGNACTMGHALKTAQLLASARSGWSFDVARLSKLTGGRPLSTLSICLFEHHGLVEDFGLDRSRLRAFFAEVERGYFQQPYHNALHAASVMHAMHCLLEHGGLAEAVAPALGEADPKLVKMACLLAAAVHDYEHLGLSNGFLVKTAHERALRHNGEHVNESHHVDAAFALLSQPELDFLEQVPATVTSRLRELAVVIVLGTDMADHGQIIKTFEDRFGTAIAGSADCAAAGSAKPRPPMQACEAATEAEAELLLQVAMKCADLGHLTLSWEEHVPWVECLEQEFFIQGDKEKELGLELSFLMDREKPGLSQTQVGFYGFVVMPLFKALTSVLPGAEPLMQGAAANHRSWKAIEDAKAQEAKEQQS